MATTLSPAHQTAIRRHGEEAFPHECCGFLLGVTEGDQRRVRDLLPAVNAREDGARHNRYMISPEHFTEVEQAARARGLNVIGFYHSHPNAAPRPSRFDVDHAWPWYAYVIVSVNDGASAGMTSWVLREDRSGFTEEELKTPPEGG